MQYLQHFKNGIVSREIAMQYLQHFDNGIVSRGDSHAVSSAL